MLSRSCLLAALLVTAAGCAVSTGRVQGVEDNTAESADEARAARASVGAFHGLLAPYGRWIEKRSLGWVWVPDAKWVGPEFFPYVTAGRWVPTDQGWMFSSDWPFGWVIFHYGRWLYEAYHGWIWVPGENWAPAWVAWRAGGDHVGWAPLPPRWHVPLRSIPSHFVFVAKRDLERPDLQSHLLRRGDLERVMKTATAVMEQIRLDAVQWYRGPSTDGASKPIAIISPRPGQLARVRIVDGKAQFQSRGTVRVRAPSRSIQRPRGWRALYRGSVPSVPGDVRPAMPPQQIEEEGQRWR